MPYTCDCIGMYNDIDGCVRVCTKARMWELLEQQKIRSKNRLYELMNSCLKYILNEC